MRDVVDLRPAIEAAAEALRRGFPSLIAVADSARVARVAIEAAATVLGLADVNAIPDTRIREPLPQKTSPRLPPGIVEVEGGL